MSNKYKTVQIDLVQEIAEATVKNKFFSVSSWSIEDGETLIKAGQMIVKEVSEANKKEEKKKAKAFNRYERYKNQPQYLKTWVTGLSSANHYHVIFEGVKSALVKCDGYKSYTNRCSGTQYSPPEYYLIKKNIGNYWHDRGKKLGEGRITKQQLEEFKKLVD